MNRVKGPKVCHSTRSLVKDKPQDKQEYVM